LFETTIPRFRIDHLRASRVLGTWLLARRRSGDIGVLPDGRFAPEVAGREYLLGRRPNMSNSGIIGAYVGIFVFIGSIVCTENLIRVDDMMESPKLAE
jgi:hypothetical protein